MSKELDIDNKTDLWIPAFILAKKGETPICPHCKNDGVSVYAEELGNNVGFIMISCDKCGKSGYFSRVDFTNYKGHIIRKKALA